jgi:hypothetical protein
MTFRKKGLQFLAVLVTAVFAGSFLSFSWAATEKAPKVGPVKINAHPASLEGKTVLLRWNGKMNGDKFLTCVGEHLTQQVKNVKIIKLWEVDKNTAAISKDLQASEQVAATIAKLKPDLVIAAQCD